MVHALWIFPFFLLIASWLIFIRYYRAQTHRESQTARKFDESRRQIAEQVSSLNVFVDLLANIHEFVARDAGSAAKAVLYRMVLDAACQIMKCPAGSLMMAEKDSAELEIVCSKGLPSQAASAMRLRFGEGIAGRAADSGKVVLVDNIETDARFINRTDVEAHLKSLVSIPLKIKTRVIGVLNVDAPGAHHVFSERDIQLLSVLADLTAMTIENLDLYNNLQLFYLEMVQTMAETLEYKEFDVKTHPPTDHTRSRQHARMIAQELRLPESIVKYVEYASLMHGIGKIGIGEAILRKPGKLTPEEYEKIKKHPEIAQQLISKVTFLSPIVPMILYHQERWDGKGYPAGLKGEEIPLGSRIVAVINAYGAMVSERPYRKALSEEQAVEELKRGAGSQFDPKVVGVFLRILERGKGSH